VGAESRRRDTCRPPQRVSSALASSAPCLCYPKMWRTGPSPPPLSQVAREGPSFSTAKSAIIGQVYLTTPLVSLPRAAHTADRPQIRVLSALQSHTPEMSAAFNSGRRPPRARPGQRGGTAKRGGGVQWNSSSGSGSFRPALPKVAQCQYTPCSLTRESQLVNTC
jgi:hypothetical protein